MTGDTTQVWLWEFFNPERLWALLVLPVLVIAATHSRFVLGRMIPTRKTEDLLLGNLEKTREVLDVLRGNGIAVAIDDFGSGYSTLAYLCDLPVDEVKLDRSFIAPTVLDSRAATVVRAVLDLAGGLGLTAVAEGIENAETAVWLREHGCPVGQGHFLSAPVGADEVPTLLEHDHLSSPRPR